LGAFSWYNKLSGTLNFMDENLQNNSDITPKTEPATSGISTRTLIAIILISLVAGVAGGVYGAFGLAKNEAVQKFFSKTGSPASFNQNLVVDEESATTEVVKLAGPAVVSIVVTKDLSQAPQFNLFGFAQDGPDIRQVGAGTGFFVNSNGTILTNKHVVSDANASYTVITNDGKSYDAKVLSRDPVSDLAIIKIEISNAPALQFADSSKIELGQHVVAIGNSLGQYQNTVTAGIVSGIGRSIIAGGRASAEELEGVIQTDAAINPGNSGGPLLNLAGQVIGINTAVDTQGQSVGFAISANDAKVALASYEKNGKITRPYLGVRYMIISEAMAKEQDLPRSSGALLLRGRSVTDFAVLPGSPADRAGLLENDIILQIDGKDVNEKTTLSGLLKDYQPGDQINLKVFSKGEEKTVTVTLGETN
jgi:serine protease Do